MALPAPEPAAPLADGVFPAAELIELATSLIPPDCPIAVLEGDAQAHPDLTRAPRYTAA